MYGYHVALSLPLLDKAGLLKRYEQPAGLSVAAKLTGSHALLSGTNSVAAAGISVAANLTNLTMSSSYGWEAVRKRLNCIVDVEDADMPNDAANAHPGRRLL